MVITAHIVVKGSLNFQYRPEWDLNDDLCISLLDEVLLPAGHYLGSK